MQRRTEATPLPELTLEQVRDSILSYLEQGNAGTTVSASLYNHTVDNKLAEKNGYESAQQFFSQHIKTLSQATLSRYGAVAREFTEEACKKYGVMNLTTLRTYVTAADIQPTSGDPGATPIDVPQEDGARGAEALRRLHHGGAEAGREEQAQAVPGGHARHGCGPHRLHA